MLLPKRIRLLQTCREHLYNEVKKTLATDKEIRALREMDKRIGDYYLRLVGATELCSTCYKGNCICRENQMRGVEYKHNG